MFEKTKAKIQGKSLAWIVKGIPMEDGLHHKTSMAAVKIAGNKLQKRWAKMEAETPVDQKKWYQSKTLWTAVVTAILGAVQPVSASLGHPVEVPMWVYSFLGAFGLYGLRTGDKTISK